MNHRHFNGLKTTLLFGFMWAVLLVIGWVLGLRFNNSSFILWFAALGLVMTAVSFWNSDKIAIRAMQAVPVTPQEQPAMYRIVTELSEKAGKPMPALYVSPTQAPNAFATGRSPDHAVVCCTQGILELLDERELRGVLGHELMHVYNRDILTSSIAAAVAGVITSLAQFAIFFGGGGGRDRRSNADGIAGLVLALLAPLAATMIQLAISRTREYDADEDGSALTGDPMALASALHKLDAGTKQRPLPAERELVNVSHLMIANPFKVGEGLSRLFSTHPPIEERIGRLEGQAQNMGQIGH